VNRLSHEGGAECANFRWIHAGGGTRPVVDGLAVFFAKGGPYLLTAMFVIWWFFVDENKQASLLEATEAATIGLAVGLLTAW
jgi:undecaprenyl-diphosphatase